MNRLHMLVVAVGLTLLAVTPSWGQQPPDPTSSDAYGNTAGGTNALLKLQTDGGSNGGDSTAFGFGALQNNTTAVRNTACGAFALGTNTTGSRNTATGEAALLVNSTGSNNTASGNEALYFNAIGSNNTAAGYRALFNNASDDNTATGVSALQANTNGTYNSAYGTSALYSNTTGNDNTASGDQALWNNTAGSGNTAVGTNSMLASKGSNNTALGYRAGWSITTGNNKIEIGNSGTAADANHIRIGAQGTQTVTYVAGVAGVNVTGGTEVVVNSSGKLGVVLSSARYKHDITDVGARSDGLMKLRPVTFRYNNDPAGTLQYGLVAEEVAKVYPELVVYGPDGKPMTVRTRCSARCCSTSCRSRPLSCAKSRYRWPVTRRLRKAG